MKNDMVHVIKHPLVQHKLSLLRDKHTETAKFRALLHEISVLLAYEVTSDLPLELETIETPICSMDAPFLRGKKLVIVSILRAGNGLLEGVLSLIPSARVGHIGLYRDPKSLFPIEYYCKLPDDMKNRDVIVVDPMLATGNTAVAAVSEIKETMPRSIKFMCLLSAPEGLKCLHDAHPDVPIFTGSIDERLDEHGYIIPGLGDAGDRLYGTKLAFEN